MLKSQENVRDFMTNAGQSVYNTLRTPSVDEKILSAKLLLEETLETIAGLGVEIITSKRSISKTEDVDLICNGYFNIIEVADGLSDVNYIKDGIAIRCGIDMEPVDTEVHDSNMSKFIDGHRRDDGKWIKGSSYKPANIARVLVYQISNLSEDDKNFIDNMEYDVNYPHSCNYECERILRKYLT